MQSKCNLFLQTDQRLKCPVFEDRLFQLMSFKRTILKKKKVSSFKKKKKKDHILHLNSLSMPFKTILHATCGMHATENTKTYKAVTCLLEITYIAETQGTFSKS